MNAFPSLCVSVAVVVHASTVVGQTSAPLELTGLERAQFGLTAALLERVVQVMAAEADGKSIQNALELSSDRLAVTIMTQSSGRQYQRLVSSQVRSALERLDFLKAQRKMAADDPVKNKARLAYLASVTEIKEKREAEKRLLEAALKHQASIDAAAKNGQDIRTDLEKAAQQFIEKLKKDPEYAEAAKKLAEEEMHHSKVDGYEPLFSHSQPIVVRVATIRYQMQAQRSWP